MLIKMMSEKVAVRPDFALSRETLKGMQISPPFMIPEWLDCRTCNHQVMGLNPQANR